MTQASIVQTLSFGLPVGPSDESREAVFSQMKAAHVYHTGLVAVARAYVDAMRSLTAEIDSDVARLTSEEAALRDSVRELRESIKSSRANSRTRTPASDSATEALKALTASIKTVREELKTAKGKVNKERLRDARKALNERATVMRKSQRAAASSGAFGNAPLYWGTYLMIEDAVDQAIDRTLRAGGAPSFRRWDGTGRIGVQIQGGMSVEKAMQCTDTRLQIDTRPIRRFTRRHPEGIEIKSSCTVRIRIGSDDHRAPVWAEFSCILHRPLPSDGVIKRAWVKHSKIGTRSRWDLQMSIETPCQANDRGAVGGSVAIDFGAKGAANGNLIARAVGDDGAIRDLVLPSRTIGGESHTVADVLRHADSIRAIRDREFNAVREELARWIGDVTPPEWLTDALRHMPRWHTPRRLARVAVEWRDARWDGDDDGFALVDAWRKQDRHLYQWESSERAKAVLWRREAARVWASMLANTYARVVVEKVDFAKLRRNSAPEATAEQAAFDHTHRTQSACAPGEAREVVKNAFRGRVVDLELAGRATRCPACLGPAVSADTRTACAGRDCGARMDADYARCWNLLIDAGCDGTSVRRNFERGREMIAEMKREVRR